MLPQKSHNYTGWKSGTAQSGMVNAVGCAPDLGRHNVSYIGPQDKLLKNLEGNLKTGHKGILVVYPATANKDGTVKVGMNVVNHYSDKFV